MGKKEKKDFFDISTKEFIIYSILLAMLAIAIPFMAMKNKKTEAYTNNVITYDNEQVTNLQNTTWLLNDNLSNASNIYYDINFISNNQEYSFFEFVTFIPMGNDSYYLAYSGTAVYSTGNWINEEYKKITFTGESQYSELIDWLYQNATLQSTGVTEEFYNITYNLQNVLIVGQKPTQISNLEEIEIEIQNFNNYELPQNIMVDGANYNWNRETGILTIYDATGNVTITVRAEYISGNYSFIELIDSVILIPLNAFFNLFNFEIFGVNIYALLTATLTLFVIIKILLKVFK